MCNDLGRKNTKKGPERNDGRSAAGPKDVHVVGRWGRWTGTAAPIGAAIKSLFELLHFSFVSQKIGNVIVTMD